MKKLSRSVGHETLAYDGRVSSSLGWGCVVYSILLLAAVEGISQGKWSEGVVTWEVQGYYSKQYGWECLTSEDSKEAGLQRLREYNENEPQYRHRIIKKREKKL